MKKILLMAVSALALATAPAMAAGELHIYNWGDYTSPDLITKFEKAFDVKVTLDSYDSNETMLSKVKAGNSGYDIVVPSDYTVKIMVDEGLLEKTEPSSMANFKNMDPRWVNIYWDDGRHYTVPWQIGATALVVDTARFKGDIDTLALLYNPPEELKGQHACGDEHVESSGTKQRNRNVSEPPKCTGPVDRRCLLEFCWNSLETS